MGESREGSWCRAVDRVHSPPMPPTYLQTSAVAAMHETSVRVVQRLAQTRGVVPALVVGKAFLWTPAQARKLKPGPRGRPKKAKPARQRRPR